MKRSASTTTIRFQSTPPVRGATQIKAKFPIQSVISIHAPREGGDVTTSTAMVQEEVFQSTPPVRGATLTLPWFRGYNGKISIHAPREGGDDD